MKGKAMEERGHCDRCGDVLERGDSYYETPTGNYCPDCMDWIQRHLWLRYVGDTVERI